MATGFQYREIQGFPKMEELGQQYVTSNQLALLLPGIDGDDTVHSIIRFLGESSHPDFWRYHVEHETVKPYTVRFNQTRRDSVIIVEKLDVFIPKNYTYLWAESKSSILNELLQRIKDTEQTLDRSFEFREQKVDLVKLGKAIQADITGGHFSQLNIVDVQAASLFGPGVGESEDWHRYEESGETSAINIKTTFRGELHTIMITRTKGIVVYSRLHEREYLELIEQVNDQLGKYIVLG